MVLRMIELTHSTPYLMLKNVKHGLLLNPLHLNMTMRISLLLALLTIVSLLQTPFVSAGNVPADEVLRARYRQLQQNIALDELQDRHQQLMDTSTNLLFLSNEALQASKKLAEYAATVQATGMMFDQPLQEVKKFQDTLERLTSHPSLQGFDQFMEIKGNYDDLIGLVSDYKTTLDNHDLPPPAKNSLLALQTIGNGFKRLSKTPILGAALEGYGEIIGGLAKTMNSLAGQVTATAQAGIFSSTEEFWYLGNLPNRQYAKTEFWKHGIRLVSVFHYGPGKNQYYLQRPDGEWTEVEKDGYTEIVQIFSAFQVTQKRTITHEELWSYLENGSARASLKKEAENELEYLRIASILRDVDGVSERGNYGRFSQVQDKVKRWHEDFRLPLTYRQLSYYIQSEFREPGSAIRMVRKRLVGVYPGFGSYLAFLGEDPQTIHMGVLLHHFRRFEKGEHLIATLDVTIEDQQSGTPIPGSSIELVGPLHRTIRVPDGRLLLEELPAGPYQIYGRADGYKPYRTDGAIEPFTTVSGTISLVPEQREARLSVTVVDAADQVPIGHAAVEISGPVSQHSRVNGGTIVFQDLPPGTYRVVVRADGYQGHGGELSIDPGASLSGTIPLVKLDVPEKQGEPFAEPDQPEETVSQKPQPAREKPADSRSCYEKKYKQIVENARRSNAKANPGSPSGMGLALLYASPQCEAAHKKCREQAWQAGENCRRNSSGDFNAINKKCNFVSQSGARDCAIQEVACSAQVYQAQCTD